MKTNFITRCCCFLVIVVLGSNAFATDVRVVRVLKSAELWENTPKSLSLNQDYMIINETQTDKKRDIPVSLVRLDYKQRILKVSEGKTTEVRGNISCYELRSMSEDFPFSWAIWSFDSLGHFRLFSDGNGKNYLLYIYLWDAYFVEIFELEDRVVALTDLLLDKGKEPSEFERIPVSKHFSKKPFIGTSSQYADINVLSLSVEDTGKITVAFTGTDKDKVYTLIREDGKWHDATNE